MGENPHDLVSLELSCDAGAPAAARAALAEQGQLGWIIGDAMLVVSELVTNAVLHSGSGDGHMLHVSARVAEDRVRICVEDSGPDGGGVSPLNIDEFADSGVGLLVVDQLVERWGAGRDGGYRVWAELALRRS